MHWTGTRVRQQASVLRATGGKSSISKCIKINGAIGSKRIAAARSYSYFVSIDPTVHGTSAARFWDGMITGGA